MTKATTENNVEGNMGPDLMETPMLTKPAKKDLVSKPKKVAVEAVEETASMVGCSNFEEQLKMQQRKMLSKQQRAEARVPTVQLGVKINGYYEMFCREVAARKNHTKRFIIEEALRAYASEHGYPEPAAFMKELTSGD